MSAERVRRRLVCRGAVQAVGFRPAVHRLATGLGLAGWVRNDSYGATIEVEGPRAAVDAFQQRLPGALPPLARLDRMLATDGPPQGEVDFVVAESGRGRRRGARIPPDAVTCPRCRAEIEDPQDRRYRYPFTTCSDCGPRYTLARSLPYDRERTAMACFPPCPACAAEYTDPSSRRFRTESICCPDCGPRLWLADGEGEGETLAGAVDALPRTVDALASGAIVAVKGLGGFQLACRADDEEAVARLRKRKRRLTRPFAVMVLDLDAARERALLRETDEWELQTACGPIVLAPRKPGAALAHGVAPGIGDLGLALPTTPLHTELFRDAPYRALVMTSGNVSDEPICRGNREALDRLAGIADLFLLHDRDIVRRVDDSVVRSTVDGPMLMRRSRGYVPQPLPLPERTPEPVLALGGYLQTTACVALRSEAYVSQHVGDLDTEPAREFLVEVARGLEDFLEARPRVIAIDLHPDYPTAWIGEKLAANRGARLLRVQHHLAHTAAVLGEHGAFPDHEERVAGLALDGTGWGTDGTAWGTEWLLVGGNLRWRRLASADPLPLVGGEHAVREPWRVAVAALARGGREDLIARIPLGSSAPSPGADRVAGLVGRGDWPQASGAGRVFEAAAALLGLVVRNEWEGEAAARFETLAAEAPQAGAPWPEVTLGPHDRLPTGDLLVAAAQRLADGQPPARMAADFHATFCTLAAGLTARVVPPDVRTIAIGGGCLVNRLLRGGLRAALEREGFRTLLPVAVPAGDGGLSYGQAVIASVATARGVMPIQEGAS